MQKINANHEKSHIPTHLINKKVEKKEEMKNIQISTLTFAM